MSVTYISIDIILPSNLLTFILPFYNFDGTIEWGDGSSETLYVNNPYHTYTNSGTYTILLKDVITTGPNMTYGPVIPEPNYYNYITAFRYLVKINNLESFYQGFQNCNNLETFYLSSPTLMDNVTNMVNMFSECTNFNQPISFDCTSCTDLNGFLQNSGSFNSSLNLTNTQNVFNMSLMFSGCFNFNQPISLDCTSCTNLSGFLQYCNSFNSSLNLTNTQNVSNMGNMLFGCTNFNKPISLDCTSCTTLTHFLENAVSFNSSLNLTNTQNVSNMSNMFYGCGNFNKPISLECTSCTTLSDFLQYSGSFNSSLNLTNTQNVSNMSNMFNGCSNFNKPISLDCTSCTTLSGFLQNAVSFNSSLNLTNTQNVSNMSNMFNGCNNFNQPISLDCTSCTTLSGFLQNAVSFNSSLNLTPINSLITTYNMLLNTNLSTINYSNLLILWGNQYLTTNNDVQLTATNIKYYENAIIPRYNLTYYKQWTITDGGLELNGFSENLYIKYEDNTYKLSYNNIFWYDFTFPFSFIYFGNTIGNVYFTTELRINNSDQYFIIGSDNIVVNGQNNVVYMDNVSDYNGLFQNGTVLITGNSNITIKNISIQNGIGTNTLASYNGWFCQNYFGKNSTNVLLDNLYTNCDVLNEGGGICGNQFSQSGTATIQNCYSTGNLFGYYTAGICGTNCASNGGNVSINNCYSTGNLFTYYTAGICGSNCASNGGNVSVDNCYSTGSISGNESGGICGSNCASNGGNVSIYNCYSTGSISDNDSGGICGPYCSYNSGNVSIHNSYSTGNISGNYSGGICGSYCAYDGGNVSIYNCYSTGNISYYYSGGICGWNCARNGGNVSIYDCYSNGLISGEGSGGICGAEAGNAYGSVIIEKCYSTGDISGYSSGGIAGNWFGELTDLPCQIINCYSRGNIVGTNAGGITGGEIAWTYNISPQVLIQNCYSYGSVSATGGSICGGFAGYLYTSNATIDHCYSTNGPFVSPTLENTVSITITDSSFSSGIWSCPTASNYLLNAPVYVDNNWISDGSIWAAQTPSSNLTLPFILIYIQETVLTDFNIPTPSVVGQLITIISPQSNREGEFVYTSSDPSIAEIVSNTYINCLTIGNVSITATQPAIEGWTEGTISSPLQINPSTYNNPTIAYNNLQLQNALENPNTTYILIEDNISGISELINNTSTNKNIRSNNNYKIYK